MDELEEARRSYIAACDTSDNGCLIPLIIGAAFCGLGFFVGLVNILNGDVEGGSPIILIVMAVPLAYWAINIIRRWNRRDELLIEISRLEEQRRLENLERTRTLQDAYSLSPKDFEGLVKSLFESMGYIVETTPTTRDEGVDLVLHKSDIVELVQCKRYQGNVGVTVVREFLGVMLDKRVTKGYIVTTGHYTLSARQFAQGKGIHLIDGPELAEMLTNRPDNGLNDARE